MALYAIGLGPQELRPETRVRTVHHPPSTLLPHSPCQPGGALLRLVVARSARPFFFVRIIETNPSGLLQHFPIPTGDDGLDVLDSAYEPLQFAFALLRQGPPAEFLGQDPPHVFRIQAAPSLHHVLVHLAAFPFPSPQPEEAEHVHGMGAEANPPAQRREEEPRKSRRGEDIDQRQSDDNADEGTQVRVEFLEFMHVLTRILFKARFKGWGFKFCGHGGMMIT